MIKDKEPIIISGNEYCSVDCAIKGQELELEKARINLIKATKLYRRINKVYFFNNYFVKKITKLTLAYQKIFRELREVMQKEYPERFIGNSNA